MSQQKRNRPRWTPSYEEYEASLNESYATENYSEVLDMMKEMEDEETDDSGEAPESKSSFYYNGNFCVRLNLSAWLSQRVQERSAADDGTVQHSLTRFIMMKEPVARSKQERLQAPEIITAIRRAKLGYVRIAWGTNEGLAAEKPAGCVILIPYNSHVTEKRFLEFAKHCTTLGEKPHVLYHSPDAEECGIYENMERTESMGTAELNDTLLKHYLRCLSGDMEQHIDFLAARQPMNIMSAHAMSSGNQYYFRLISDIR